MITVIVVDEDNVLVMGGGEQLHEITPTVMTKDEFNNKYDTVAAVNGYPGLFEVEERR